MAAAVVAATMGLGLQACGEAEAVPAEGVKEISVSLVNRPDGGAEIRSFVVAPEHHEGIVGLFQGAVKDPSPRRWQGLGSVMIAYENGRTREVLLFWTGEGVGAFKVGGAYYRGSNDAAIVARIVKARDAK